MSASQQSFSSTPGSTHTAFASIAISTMSTPVSVILEEGYESPRPRKIDAQPPISDTVSETLTLASTVESRSGSSIGNHARQVSDAGSVMDRGRPRKPSGKGLEVSGAKKNKSAERRAFETLPKGWKVPEAIKMLESSETLALNKQALEQAGRFEVLRKSDVDSLSRVSAHDQASSM